MANGGIFIKIAHKAQGLAAFCQKRRPKDSSFTAINDEAKL